LTQTDRETGNPQELFFFAEYLDVYIGDEGEAGPLHIRTVGTVV
jgi:hypothetical protein